MIGREAWVHQRPEGIPSVTVQRTELPMAVDLKTAFSTRDVWPTIHNPHYAPDFDERMTHCKGPNAMTGFFERTYWPARCLKVDAPTNSEDTWSTRWRRTIEEGYELPRLWLLHKSNACKTHYSRGISIKAAVTELAMNTRNAPEYDKAGIQLKWVLEQTYGNPGLCNCSVLTKHKDCLVMDKPGQWGRHPTEFSRIPEQVLALDTSSSTGSGSSAPDVADVPEAGADDHAAGGDVIAGSVGEEA